MHVVKNNEKNIRLSVTDELLNTVKGYSNMNFDTTHVNVNICV